MFWKVYVPSCVFVTPVAAYICCSWCVHSQLQHIYGLPKKSTHSVHSILFVLRLACQVKSNFIYRTKNHFWPQGALQSLHVQLNFNISFKDQETMATVVSPPLQPFYTVATWQLEPSLTNEISEWLCGQSGRSLYGGLASSQRLCVWGSWDRAVKCFKHTLMCFSHMTVQYIHVWDWIYCRIINQKPGLRLLVPSNDVW